MMLGVQANAQENIAIVYLSRTKNTEAVAKLIHDKVGGYLVALEKQDKYPEDYQEIVAQVDRENEEGYLPPLKTKIENLETYNIIFIGFPTWDMQLPPPMKSFLTENDLSDKIIVPFNTNAGFGVGKGFDQLIKLCPDSEVVKGLSVEGGYEKKGVYLSIKGKRKDEVSRKVDNWLKEIGISR
ncbi:flavodoxin [Christiangramia salexigens]|uniref:Flavodoxin n=2 Tax=Christiangramia salexigens TaxID=1913577 RepID=A0A1L3J8B6_9FLAO|nr:flavodoxin [Christiangramia salexigens]